MSRLFYTVWLVACLAYSKLNVMFGRLDSCQSPFATVYTATLFFYQCGISVYSICIKFDIPMLVGFLLHHLSPTTTSTTIPSPSSSSPFTFRLNVIKKTEKKEIEFFFLPICSFVVLPFFPTSSS